MNNEITGPPAMDLMMENFLADIGQKQRRVVWPNQPIFRPGTALPCTEANYVFSGDGMGDHIAWSLSIAWLAKYCPWILGRLHVPRFEIEFMKNILRDFKHWEVLAAEDINYNIKAGQQLVGPNVTIRHKQYAQLLNGTGGRLVDCGFAYFANKFPAPPEGDIYPVLDLSNVQSTEEIDTILGGKYIVFTTGGVSECRTVPGAYWNPIIDHVLACGYTPVFVGKSKLSDALNVKFPDGCDYHKGIDLRNKTTMTQAAFVMANARMTLGLDNGLIHLASCTDASIICAYNIVNPEDRRPKRKAGQWIELTVPREELACTGCQSNMKAMFKHNFQRCLYGDNLCVDMLFQGGGYRWTSAINNMLA